MDPTLSLGNQPCCVITTLSPRAPASEQSLGHPSALPANFTLIAGHHCSKRKNQAFTRSFSDDMQLLWWQRRLCLRGTSGSLQTHLGKAHHGVFQKHHFLTPGAFPSLSWPAARTPPVILPRLSTGASSLPPIARSCNTSASHLPLQSSPTSTGPCVQDEPTFYTGEHFFKDFFFFDVYYFLNLYLLQYCLFYVLDFWPSGMWGLSSPGSESESHSVTSDPLWPHGL